MRTFNLIVGITVLMLCFSCGKSTEKYASKEHGMKFNVWELNYNADNYDIYWPSIKLTEPTEGELVEVESNYNWWSGRLNSRDTTSSSAMLRAFIFNEKSKNDAQYYNTVQFKVSNADYEYRSHLAHCFVFNEGQIDSVSFSAKADDNHCFIPDRETSEKIIRLFCGKSPINVKVTFTGHSIEGVYFFTVDGSPKLNKALEVNHERFVLARKESNEKETK